MARSGPHERLDGVTARGPTREFLLGETELDELLRATGERFGVATDGRERSERLVLDTADRRLRSKGVELSFEPDGKGGRGHLALRDPGRPTVRAAAAAQDLYRAADLPGGPIAERISPLIDVRALLPVVRLCAHERRWRVLDPDEKTVVRVGVVSARVLRERRSQLRLEPRIELRPVLGYDRAAEELTALLSGELGLEPAEEALLDDAVRAAGGDPVGIVTKVRPGFGPREPADRATVSVLHELAGVVDANLQGTLDDVDPEFLHDLRVAVRRSRSVLRQMKGVLPADERDRFRADLKWLQQATGPVRDLDVQLIEWDGLVAGLPPELRADLASAPSLLERRRAAALTAMRRKLRSARFKRFSPAWHDFLSRELPAPGDDRPNARKDVAQVAGKRIRREYRRMLEMGEAIDDDSPGEALHDLRKRGKELRYLLELFGHLWPADTVKPLVAVLKDLQDVLGRHQDTEVQASSLRAVADDLIASGEPGATAMALGVVVEGLHREQARVRGHFAERFAEFAAPERRKAVKQTFRGPA